jgi:integrase
MAKTFATKREATAHLDRVRGELVAGTYVAPARQTLKEFLEEWHEGRKAQLRPSTWDGYRRCLTVHVYPHVGGVRLADLDAGHLNRLYAHLLEEGRRPYKEGRPAVVADYARRRKAKGATWQAIADELAEKYPQHGPYSRHAVAAIVRRADEAAEAEKEAPAKGLAPRSVQQVHTILKRALKDAVRWGRIARNPADLVDPPRRTVRNELRTWSSDEVRTFLECCAAEDDRLLPLWHFLASTGVRRGEALGLRWSDVDLGTATAQVVHTIVEVRGEVLESEPKTAAGRRRLELDPATVTVLRRWKARQAEERLALGSGWTDTGLVFTALEGGPLHPERTSREFVRRVHRHGLPHLSVHGLRHTWATLAMRNNQHPRVVQERLGHTSIAVTLGVYSHVTPSHHREAAELVAGLFAYE